MKFKERDVLPKIIIQKTLGLAVIMLIFMVFCDFGFKEVLEPYRIPLLGLSLLWIVSAGLIIFKEM